MAIYAFTALLIFVLTSNVYIGVSCYVVGSVQNVHNGVNFSQGKRLELGRLKNSLEETDDKADKNSDEVNKDDKSLLYLRNADIPVKSAKIFPRFDSLDRTIATRTLPLIISIAMNPILGAIDLFWVNQMGNPLAVAGQAAGAQAFSTASVLTIVLTSVSLQQVAKAAAKDDKKGLQDTVCATFFIGGLVALLGTPFFFFKSNLILRTIMEKGSPAMQFAKPYLLIRSLALYFTMICTLAPASFRGIQDTKTPVIVAFVALIINAILDPILIFTFGMGLSGAAIATVIAEIVAAITYLVILRKKGMVRVRKIFSIPAWDRIEPFLKGGSLLQLRGIAINLTFLMVTRVTQSIDKTGVAAAAHALAIQTFQVGAVVLFGLSLVAQFVIPNEMIETNDEKTGRKAGGFTAARAVVNRLMSWGFILGTLLGLFQLAILPIMQKSTPMVEVRKAARIPSLLASFYQIFNGLVFIGEGIMIATENYLQLSISTVIATGGCLWALNTLPQRYGLAGVWLSFGVWNMIRLVGVLIHQQFTGRLAPRNLAKTASIQDKS